MLLYKLLLNILYEFDIKGDFLYSVSFGSFANKNLLVFKFVFSSP